MAEITGFTAARMKEIEDSTIVHGVINDEDNLILYTRDGKKINAGHIRGGTAQWIRDIAPVITEQGGLIEALDDRYKEIGEDLRDTVVKADDLEEELTKVANKADNTIDLVGNIQTTINNNETKAGQAIKETTVEYALADNQETAPTEGWSTDYPERTEEQPFVWVKTTIERVNGQKLYTPPIPYTATPEDGAEGPMGAQGPPGPKGDKGDDGLPGKAGTGLVDTVVTYARSTSGTVEPTSGWTPQPPSPIKGQYLWTKTVWSYSDGTDETGFSVAYWAQDGATGEDGIAGKDGVGIDSTTISYAQSTSGTTPPTSDWQSTPPSPIAGRYIWTRTIWTYTDNSTETGYSVGKIGDTGAKGDKGDTGADGLPGKDGLGLKSTAISYAKSTSGTATPTSGWQNAVPTSTPGQFLWTRTVWTYTDNNTETGYSVAQWGETGAKGAKGDKGDTGSQGTPGTPGTKGDKGDTGNDGIAGKDGVGITKTDITYAQSTSGTTAPTTGWQSTPPTAVAGRYVWTKTVWTYSDGTTETGYSVGKIGDTGAKGDKGATGNTGATGTGVSDLTPYYISAKNYAPDPSKKRSTVVELLRNINKHTKASSASLRAEYFTSEVFDGYRAIECTAELPNNSYILIQPNAHKTPISGGGLYGAAMTIRNTSETSLSLRIRIDGDVNPHIAWKVYDVPPGDTVDLVLDPVEVPSNETALGVNLISGTSTVPLGATFDVLDGTLLYKGVPRTRPRAFDGDTEVDDGLSYRWLESGESSILGYGVYGMISANATAISAKYGGRPALLISPYYDTSNNSRPAYLVPSLLHDGGTVAGTLNLDHPISGVLNTRALGLMSFYPIEGHPKGENTPGSQFLLRKLEPFTSEYKVSWTHGGYKGSGDVWWTDLGLYEGDLTNPNTTEWSETAPPYKPGHDVFSAFLVTYTNGQKHWTEVTKEPGYDIAQQAINIANISAEQLKHALDEEPPEEPVDGAVWFERNDKADIVGVWQWDGVNWGVHAVITGMLIVPGADGKPTIIDENGIDATDVVADIMSAKLIWGDEMGTKNLLISDIPRENLESGVVNTLKSADDIKKRILITNNDISIMKDNGSVLRLTATSIDMVVKNKVVLSANSEKNRIIVPDMLADSATVGNHRMRVLPDNPNITVFQQLT